MEQGKLTNDDLRTLILSRLGSRSPEVVQGPGIGEDCAAVDTGGLVILTTDPITAVDANAGLLAMHINANDVAAAGAIPFAALATILVPPAVSREQIEEVSRQLNEAGRELGVEIIGGHTEITTAVRRLVISLTMIGRPVVPGRFLATADMRPGDAVIMSKYAGIEGTLILAHDRSRELERILDATDREQIEYLRGCLSVLPEGRTGASDPKVSAMHDITEGGLIGAAWEMGAAAGLGMRIDTGKVPIMPVTRKICDFFRIDPLRLISSGSMLITASEQTNILGALADQGIPATVIGHVTEEKGLKDAQNGEELVFRPQDELYRVIQGGEPLQA
ncbi:MAG: AIR synthase [Clostridia bacterium]|nr:AIR synthase [Clostridia bacterium]